MCLSHHCCRTPTPVLSALYTPGLEDAKQDLREMVELPMTRPDLFEHPAESPPGTNLARGHGDSADSSSGDDDDDYDDDDDDEYARGSGTAAESTTSKRGTVRGRSGILLYGPPGTGKTLLVGFWGFLLAPKLCCVDCVAR